MFVFLFKDHLHPAAFFYNSKREDYLNDEDFHFIKTRPTGTVILNLQLLNGILNQSKLNTPLAEWVLNNRIDKLDQLIPDVSLDVKDLRNFLAERKKPLVGQLKRMVA